MIKKIVVLIAIGALMIGCHQKKSPIDTFFNYPDSKIWAHQANDTTVAQTKEKLFAGLEVDLIFSDYQNTLFVGHDKYDTIRNNTFEMWLASLDAPQNIRFWLDIKNLSIENARIVAQQVSDLASKYEIKENIFIEHTNPQALKIVKEADIAIIFWVDNIYYWWDNRDTTFWANKVKKEVNDLKPDAISGEQNIHPLLADTFPDMNIHYWNTPMKNYEKNVQRTKDLCKYSNVKVVLVDYDEPVEY